MRACDGKTSAREIAQQLIPEASSGLENEQQIFSVLHELARRRVIVWTLELPVQPYPERGLRSAIKTIPNVELRERLSAPLSELEAARDAVAQASGDAGRLDASMERFEAAFSRITGKCSKRYDGQTYAGRTPLYHDCARDLEIEIGLDFFTDTATALALVLRSARWYTHTIAAQFQDYLDDLYERMSRKSNSVSVGFADVWSQMNSEAIVLPIIEDVADQLTRRWMALLAYPPAARSVRFSSETLLPQVGVAFDAPHPGWPRARYQSPDVMIAARSAEGIRSGNFELVLGELHAGTNMLMHPALLPMHSDPGKLITASERDRPDPEIHATPRRVDRCPRAMTSMIMPESDLHLAYDETPSALPPERVIPIHCLTLQKDQSGLFLYARDKKKRYSCSAIFAMILGHRSATRFSILPRQAHTPRVTVDSLIVCRERWRFPARSLAFPFLSDTAQRFVTARRWVRDQGLPRWAFCSVPRERKPIYVDFKSPVLVDLLSKYVRGAARKGDAQVTLTEMLPTPEQCWLVDAQGNSYTGELRLATVDPVGWQPAHTDTQP